MNPELNTNGPELDPNDCNMLCASTTVGEYCGGFYKMLVYEITAYLRCHLEVAEDARSFAYSEDEQIIGHPWDFQEKHVTTDFMPKYGPSSLSNSSLAGVCDV